MGLCGLAALDLKLLGEERELQPLADRRLRVGERELVWRAEQLEDYHINFVNILGEGTGWSAVYACSYIRSDREQAAVRVLPSSGAHSKVHQNGQEI